MFVTGKKLRFCEKMLPRELTLDILHSLTFFFLFIFLSFSLPRSPSAFYGCRVYLLSLFVE